MHEVRISQFLGWSPDVAGESKYKPVVITAGQGRRLSELTKISVDLGLRVSDGLDVDHIIFSSRHGELSNAAQLIRMLGKREVLSPTLFSQSVHNTAIGAYSLLKKTHAATTALSGGEDSFMMGLVSCAAYLRENPKARVLYIAGDEAVPDTFAQCVKEQNIPALVAMIVESGGPHPGLQFRMSQQNDGGNNDRSEKGSMPEPQTLKFMRWYQSKSDDMRLSGSSLSWSLRKCSVV